MSYILDALNKSEKERAAKKAPGLSSLADEKPTTGLRARHYLIGLVALAAINSVLVYWFFGEKLKTSEPIETVTVEASKEVSVSQPEIPTPQPDPVLTFAELPVSVQEEIARIDVTAHIFASDPNLRMVKIDNVELYEGDNVSSALTLSEITETGIVVEYQGFRHSVEVLEDWQVD